MMTIENLRAPAAPVSHYEFPNAEEVGSAVLVD
jgi:hypothetical protein